jgi:hypothetical protein
MVEMVNTYFEETSGEQAVKVLNSKFETSRKADLLENLVEFTVLV